MFRKFFQPFFRDSKCYQQEGLELRKPKIDKMLNLFYQVVDPLPAAEVNLRDDQFGDFIRLGQQVNQVNRKVENKGAHRSQWNANTP
jgi:hypothetical protein